MSKEAPDVNESKSPADVPDLGEVKSPVPNESPYAIQPLDVEERGAGREGFGARDGTESRGDVVPAGIDPDESPFALQAIEGLPFREDSEEAMAIREVIEQAKLERASTSPSAGVSAKIELETGKRPPPEALES